MSHPNNKPRWNPYLVGAGIGVLSWVAFGIMGKALGVSTSFVTVAGLLESIFAADHVRANPYYAKLLVDAPSIDWQFLLVVGLLIGAFLSARLGGSSRVEHVPDLWAWRFGPGRMLRYAAAVVGGILVLFGARMAGGCTSGHAISGGLQMAVGSWVFFVGFFAAGLVTALALYGKEGRGHV